MENIDLDMSSLLLLGFAAVALIMLFRSFSPDTRYRKLGMHVPDPMRDRRDRLAGIVPGNHHQALFSKSLGLKLLAAAGLIFIGLNFLLFSDVFETLLQDDSRQIKQQQQRELEIQRVKQQQKASAEAESPMPTDPPGTQTPAIPDSPLAVKPGLVNLSISRIFNPVKLKIAAVSQPGSELLSEERPRVIKKEPRYFSAPLYGHFAFGQAEFYFAFDKVEFSHPVLYLDRNQNGDLSDDGPALQNQGNGRFATEISLPYSLINPELQVLGDYIFWFYTNENLWQKKRASHYSRLQLSSELKLGEKWFHVWLAERGYNDADFSNDGLYIDINQDDKIDTGTEHVNVGEPVEIDGSKYIFLINNN